MASVSVLKNIRFSRFILLPERQLNRPNIFNLEFPAILDRSVFNLLPEALPIDIVVPCHSGFEF